MVGPLERRKRVEARRRRMNRQRYVRSVRRGRRPLFLATQDVERAFAPMRPAMHATPAPTPRIFKSKAVPPRVVGPLESADADRARPMAIATRRLSCAAGALTIVLLQPATQVDRRAHVGMTRIFEEIHAGHMWCVEGPRFLFAPKEK